MTSHLETITREECLARIEKLKAELVASVSTWENIIDLADDFALNDHQCNLFNTIQSLTWLAGGE